MPYRLPKQWDIYQTATGATRILLFQSDILLDSRTRLVMPVVTRAAAPPDHPRLLPVVLSGDEVWVAVALNIATLSLPEIGTFVASAEHARDEVKRALDMVLSGV